MTNTDWKTKFLKTYANLPYSAREEIIAVLENAPFTWNSAKIEIENDTPKGQQILELIVKLNIIKNDDHQPS